MGESVGWKLGVLKRRRAHLEKRLDEQRAAGVSWSSLKHDEREWEALDWAIVNLEPLVPAP